MAYLNPRLFRLGYVVGLLVNIVGIVWWILTENPVVRGIGSTSSLGLLALTLLLVTVVGYVALLIYDRE